MITLASKIAERNEWCKHYTIYIQNIYSSGSGIITSIVYKERNLLLEKIAKMIEFSLRDSYFVYQS